MPALNPLPTFEEMCVNAQGELNDVLDGILAAWQPGTGPTARQVEDLYEARQHIAKAKAALDRAARKPMTTNDQCRVERVSGAPLLGVCTKPKGHMSSPDPADRKHRDEGTGEQWSKSQ